MIKLSIISINLNASENLQKTLHSITLQTFKDFELIVIDGGSTDDSVQIIKQNEAKISYWISEPDSGIYNAMNKGILKSKGEYCFFLNSGDYLVNCDVLTNVFANDLNEDVITGNLLVCIKGNVIGRCLGKEQITFLDLYGSLLKHQATFIKRELFHRSGLYNEDLKIVGDYEFFIRTLGFEGASFRFIDLDISYFDNNGISNNNESLVSLEKHAVIKKYIPSRMVPDYEHFYKYQSYKVITKYWFPKFLLRLIAKGTKVYLKLFRIK